VRVWIGGKGWATFGHDMGEVGMDEITVEKERRERTNGRKEEN
jgi:hypothetical protein